MIKKVVLILVVMILLVLLFPIPMRLKDGGSVEYRALFYTVTDVHRLNPDMESEQPYLEGVEIEVLGARVFSNVK